MNICVLHRPCWHRLERRLMIAIWRPLLARKESHGTWSSSRNWLKAQLCSNPLEDNCHRTGLPSLSHLLSQSCIISRHFFRCQMHSHSPNVWQKGPSHLRIVQEIEILSSSMSARGLQTAEPTETRLSLDDPDFRDFVLDTLERYNEAQDKVTRGDITEKERKAASRVISDLSPAATKIGEWESIRQDIQTLRQLREDDKDPEMKTLADQELNEYNESLDAIEDEVLQLISPRDAHDDNDVILEFTAGVGGQEAMLFTADVFSMYQKFASHMKWRFQVLDFGTTDLGGVRHATASVKGHQAYKRFKFEAGVHRVQRIPKTEKSGRVHTSTMTVAVLPQPKQIDIKLESKDLRLETKKASGAGGQHVNTTDSAVRIVHLPTGIVAECQQDRSQIKNKQIAMELLQAKIYSQRLEQQTKVEQNLRKQQVGSSARSEKIRTYNFAQDRITDHRVGMSVHGMESFLSGGEMLEEMTDRLVEQQTEETLRVEVEEFVRERQKGSP